MRRTPSATPTPMPALAPLERPEVLAMAGDVDVAELLDAVAVAVVVLWRTTVLALAVAPDEPPHVPYEL